MTASQVSQVESGKRADPQFSTIVRLAAALRVSLDEVVAHGTGAFGTSSSSVAERDPIAPTEVALLAIQRDVTRLERKVTRALDQLRSEH